MRKSREDLVELILAKSKQINLLYILAVSETEELEEIYCKLYNIL